jgi:hypothetical protein
MDYNWSKYNETLVKRGEFYLDAQFVKTWPQELTAMNAEKRGRPYVYPDGLMDFCSVAYCFMQLPYRQMEGFLRRLGGFLGFPAPDYTTPFRRMQKLDWEIPQTDEPVVIAVDATGMKVTTRGEWLYKTWRGKEQKGWIKIHVAVDVETKKMLAFEISDSRCHDSTMFPNLLDGIPNVKNVFGDGAYGNRPCYNYCEKRGMDEPPALKLHKNCIIKPQHSWLRQKAVLEWKKLGYEGWRDKHEYGKRWAVEGFFSAVKRCFGEGLRARSVEGMMREVEMKFKLYNLML